MRGPCMMPTQWQAQTGQPALLGSSIVLLPHPARIVRRVTPRTPQCHAYNRQRPAAEAVGSWVNLGSPAPRPPNITLQGNIFGSVQDAMSYMASKLHSYELDAIMSAEDSSLLEELLLHHPKSASKIGSGIAFFSVGISPYSQNGVGIQTRCFFVNRTDGTMDDFSYVKSLVNYVHNIGVLASAQRQSRDSTMQRLIDDLQKISLGSPEGPDPKKPEQRGPVSQAAAHQTEASHQASAAGSEPWGSEIMSLGATGSQPGRAPQSPPPLQPQQGGQQGFSAAQGRNSQPVARSQGPWTQPSRPQPTSSGPWSAPAQQPHSDPLQNGTQHRNTGRHQDPGAPQSVWPQSSLRQGSNSTQYESSAPQPYGNGVPPQFGVQRGLPAFGGVRPLGGMPDVSESTWQEVLRALRLTITAQIWQFRDTTLANSHPPMCPVTGTWLTTDNCQVTYQHPQTFKVLVVDWMRSERLTDRRQVFLEWQSNIHVVPGQQGQQLRQQQLVMSNPAQVASWRAFHGIQARMVLMAKP